MTPRDATRVVYDCNIYFQALISPRGPAGACLTAAYEHRVLLFCSAQVIDEVLRTAARPDLRQRFGMTDARVSLLIESVEKVATFVTTVPEVFTYPRDPSDAHYINLALATSSAFVVTRDKDLLDLANPSRPEAREFRRRFPDLQILEPAELLAELARSPEQC
jgi:putative PIN family toxin of toxin-antitoxin system